MQKDTAEVQADGSQRGIEYPPDLQDISTRDEIVSGWNLVLGFLEVCRSRSGPSAGLDGL